MLREKCSFRQAQQNLGGLSGHEGCRIFIAGGLKIPEPDAEPEPDDTVGFMEPAEPGDQIKATLAEAATFYNELLLSDPEKYSKVLTYLARRGVEKSRNRTISDWL
jgi:DNA primase